MGRKSPNAAAVKTKTYTNEQNHMELDVEKNKRNVSGETIIKNINDRLYYTHIECL